MEKRNFVTPLRMSDDNLEGIISDSAAMFSKDACEKKSSESFEKKASAEDARTDSLS